MWLHKAVACFVKFDGVRTTLSGKPKCYDIFRHFSYICIKFNAAINVYQTLLGDYKLQDTT
jgi:hypothetical protein